MSCSENAIEVHDLSKSYQMYHQPRDRLKQFILPRLQRILGSTEKKYFAEFWALRDVSFEVKKGKSVGIVGRNGSGKSTILQIVCGVLSPTLGNAAVSGRVASILELGTGFNPEFTGRENVYINAGILGLTTEEIEQRMEAILSFADIGEFIDQPVKTYSSGMYVRLGFAIIAHVDADILIVDEALSVGDAFFVQKCMRFLREFMETGTLLFVSHDMGAVMRLCDQAIWLDSGKIKASGDPKHVTEKYMEELYEGPQKSSVIDKGEAVGADDGQSTVNDNVGKKARVRKDKRLDYVDDEKSCNDIQISEFNRYAMSFGRGGAKITDVVLEDENGDQLSWVVGGELVSLRIACEIKQKLASPIIGFFVKDRLGQALFGDNSFSMHAKQSGIITKGQRVEAVFQFYMPLLPTGDYSVCVAIADGSIENHIQHHWIHDALIFKVISSSVRNCLVGIPMQNIELNIQS